MFTGQRFATADGVEYEFDAMQVRTRVGMPVAVAYDVRFLRWPIAVTRLHPVARRTGVKWTRSALRGYGGT